MPITKGTIEAIDKRAAEDPEFAAAVEAELASMHVAQDLVALRNAAGMSQRDVARKMGVKQPVIAKLEAGKSRNVGLETITRAVTAMGGHIDIRINHPKRAASARPRRRERVLQARRRNTE